MEKRRLRLNQKERALVLLAAFGAMAYVTGDELLKIIMSPSVLPLQSLAVAGFGFFGGLVGSVITYTVLRYADGDDDERRFAERGLGLAVLALVVMCVMVFVALVGGVLNGRIKIEKPETAPAGSDQQIEGASGMNVYTAPIVL